MNEKWIKDALHKKYIEPTKKRREQSIGIEIELPILNMTKSAVDFTIVHKVTQRFKNHFKFNIIGTDEEGNISALADLYTGDILSYDCSYNNLELSFGKEKELNAIDIRFRLYYSYLQEELKKENHMLTGMGVNPHRKYNNNIPIPNGRYRMLYHHLHSYSKYNIPMYFHSYPEFGTFSRAAQGQLYVDYDDLIQTINAFTKLEPLKAILFSNSVLPELDQDLLCCRDVLWESSTHGINPHNVGMYDCEFYDIDQLQRYIESESIYCVERDGRYINFSPINVIEYFLKDRMIGEYYEDGKYKKIEFSPKSDDIKYMRTFKFEDLTFRGTIEFRSVCAQPVSDTMSVAAFHIGLKEKIDVLSVLLQEDNVIYNKGYTATELRRLLVKKELPFFIEEEQVYDLTQKVLDVAWCGLEARGYGEEKWLLPLYKRVREKTNPAKTMMTQLGQGIRIEDIIKQYAAL